MKIKKLLLSFVLMMSVIFAAACKDKGDPAPADPPPATKSDSTVTVSVENRDYLVGECLEDIELIVANGSTKGTVSWDDEEHVLTQGQNTCNWSFEPEDTENYNAKTGTITINALVKPDVVANVVDGQTVYIDARYSSIELEATATFGGVTVEGQIMWKKPLETFKEDVQNECIWQFIPTDRTTYAIVEGKIYLEATAAQVQTGIQVYNTKTEYVAYDEIDKNALTICRVYNEGKAEEITDVHNIEVIYNDPSKNLQVQDTSVTISYEGYTTILDGLTVNFKEIDVPVFNENVVYSGNEKILRLAANDDSIYYTYTPVTAIDADKYDLTVTLKDPANTKWVNGDDETTTVVCEILKAELVEYKIHCAEEYDGAEHYAEVSNNIESNVYYSEVELNSENYGLLGQDEFVKKTDAGEYTVYYYMEGDTNHNGKAGTLSINISKQTPTISLEYCYTLATGNVVNYPTDYVSIVDKQANTLNASGVQMTYYTTYSNDSNSSNDEKTTEDDGAAGVGAAPKNANAKEYYVVVRFTGDNNYNAAEGYTVLFIEGDNLGLYAKNSEDKFAFKYEANGFYGASRTINEVPVSVSGSNTECNAYLEFEELDIDANGLKIIKFDSKFDAGVDAIKTGRLVCVSGQYQLLSTDGSLYPFNYDKLNQEIKVNDGVINEVTLVKWEFPKYLKTFTAQTVSDSDYNAEKNTSKFTEITFYNHYGTIRFSAKVNTVYIGGSGDVGGYEEWSGVAEIDFVNPDGQHLSYGLSCYIISKDSLESAGYEKLKDGFNVSWYYYLNTSHEPEAVKMYGQPQGSSLLGSMPYSALLDLSFAEKTA